MPRLLTDPNGLWVTSSLYPDAQVSREQSYCTELNKLIQLGVPVVSKPVSQEI